MKINYYQKSILNLALIVFFSLLSLASGNAQELTKVSGRVIDAQTKEPLAFVNLNFLNTYTGTSTDLDGKFTISSKFATDTLLASFIGYKEQRKFIITESKQKLNFELTSESLNIETVTISAKKEKYSKKNNPAVDLIEKVMGSSKENHLKALDYYSYDKYEKVQLDVNNLTEEFKETMFMDHFSVIFDYIDTSKVNGKTFLPLFLREIRSKYYYRKSPESDKEIRKAIKISKFDDEFDVGSINDVIDLLYQDIDLYENNVNLLDHQFISPLSPIATNFYRFYILDTTEFRGESVIELAFIPKIKENFGFTGQIYVSNDDRNSIVKIDMGIRGEINLNFVRDLKIVQEFIQVDDEYVLSKDELTIDYAFTKNSVGFFGSKSVDYKNFNFEKSDVKEAYSGVEKVVIEPGAYDRSETFWEDNRLSQLSKNQEGLYIMMDSLQKVDSYKRMVYLTRLGLTGFVPFGPVDIGSMATFISYTEVEGYKPRFGFETNFKFSKKFQIKSYVSYGTRDKKYKYLGDFIYTFNDDYYLNPLHQIQFGISRQTSFPGANFRFINNDNVFLSFKRGVSNKMILSDIYKTTYLHEGKSMDVTIVGQVKKEIPYGALTLPFQDQNGERQLLDQMNTTEIDFGFKYAPNSQFVQGREHKIPIFNQYPVFKFKYTKGFKDILGGEYSYDRLYGSVFKRFYLGIFGYANVELEGGKIWGEVPYLMMNLPRANQTYFYQLRTYNMMNFLEFVSDEFASIRIDQYFQGLFFNRIPGIRKLKLRSVMTFSAIQGRMTNRNNPEMNPRLVQLPVDENGNPTTFLFDKKTPYIEASIGIKNIFKFVRVDLIRRFTYLDHPDIPDLFDVKGLGIRVRFKIEF